MAVDYMKKGTFTPILYWENKQGHIKLMPTNDVLTLDRLRRYMDKTGFMLRSAETIPQAEKLQKKLQEQMKQEQEFELAKDEHMVGQRRQAIRDRMRARMQSASCSVYEREFISTWLSQDNARRDLFRRRFTQEVGHLDALEFDNPDNHLHDLLDKT